MEVGSQKNISNNISRWLFAGVIMLMVQILLGGVTRLTESGLSITEWKPLTGVLPPLNPGAMDVENLISTNTQTNFVIFMRFLTK